jgi:ubiquinone/menaquinone biosynthesis C-methylase UbiE
MTPRMVAKARTAAAGLAATNLEFVEDKAEKLPFAHKSFGVARGTTLKAYKPSP